MQSHSWSLVDYSWSPVVIRGHSCVLLDTIDEDQRRRRNNQLHWRKGKSLALKICDTFDKSAVKNSLWVFVFLRPRYSLRFPRLRLYIILFYFFLKLSSKMFPLNGSHYYSSLFQAFRQWSTSEKESERSLPSRSFTRFIFRSSSTI